MSAAWSSAARGWCPYAEITRAPVLSVPRGGRRGFGQALQQKHLHREPWRPSLLSQLYVQPSWLVVALQTHVECGTQQQPPLWPKPRYWHGSVTHWKMAYRLICHFFETVARCCFSVQRGVLERLPAWFSGQSVQSVYGRHLGGCDQTLRWQPQWAVLWQHGSFTVCVHSDSLHMRHAAIISGAVTDSPSNS